MPGETGAAHRRIPLSPYSPDHIVLTRRPDGTFAVELPCKRGHLHGARVEILDAPGCTAVHFVPGSHYQHDATFIATHGTPDHDDAAAIATINARARATADDRARAHTPGFGNF